jgi:hypothetical protein
VSAYVRDGLGNGVRLLTAPIRQAVLRVGWNPGSGLKDILMGLWMLEKNNLHCVPFDVGSMDAL